MTAKMDSHRSLEHALANARRITVLSGAGISAESGVPTFRDPGGLWEGVDPMMLASVEGFRADPERVWRWYRFRLGIIGKVGPNPGHLAIAELERHREVTVVTQNVDGLHQAAGSSHIVELHGNIRRTRCIDPDCRRGDGPSPLEGDEVPMCPCGRPRRPAVVWFGEDLPQTALAEAVAASEGCDVALVVGTSGLVEPAASLPGIALAAGVYVAEINPEPTPLSASVHHRERGPAGTILPRLLRRVFG